MPKIKGRLRDFLEVTLDSEAFDGVQWLDPPNRTRFRIPWSHRSNSHWRPEDGAILKAWAVARGRYTGGKEDYPKWKENFRNALNKSPCISRDGGTQEDNCMVLSFVGKVQVQDSQVSSSDDYHMVSLPPLPGQQVMPDFEKIRGDTNTPILETEGPTVVTLSALNEDSQLIVDVNVYVEDYNSQWEPAEEGLDLASLSIGSIEITQSDEQLSATKYIEGLPFDVEVFYQDQSCSKHTVTSGCHLYYGKTMPAESPIASFERILMPDGPTAGLAERYITHILKNLVDGFIIERINNDIYATRIGQLGIRFTTAYDQTVTELQHWGGHHLMKTKVFSSRQWRDSHTDAPRAVTFIVGQKVTHAFDKRNTFIYVTATLPCESD